MSWPVDIGAAGSLVAVVGGAWRFLARPAVLHMLSNVVKELKSELHPMRQELQPNGGASMKDAVTRLGIQMEAVQDHLRLQDDAIGEVREEARETNRRIDHLYSERK